MAGSKPRIPGVTIKIKPGDLDVGAVLAVHDRHLHVRGVDRDRAVAVRTAEFSFLIHFLRDEVVNAELRTPRQAAKSGLPLVCTHRGR
jgi:hypothetical protein